MVLGEMGVVKLKILFVNPPFQNPVYGPEFHPKLKQTAKASVMTDKVVTISGK